VAEDSRDDAEVGTEAVAQELGDGRARHVEEAQTGNVNVDQRCGRVVVVLQFANLVPAGVALGVDDEGTAVAELPLVRGVVVHQYGVSRAEGGQCVV
jgi:hypothetical protein